MTFSTRHARSLMTSAFAVLRTWQYAVMLCVALCSVFAALTFWQPDVVLSSADSSLHVANGVLYRGNVPFDGAVAEHFSTGQEKRRTPYRLGLREGEMRAWHENGVLAESRFYELGREHGTHRAWYSTGAKRFEFAYVRGVAEGTQREWYPDGSPYTQFEYVHGHEAGRQRMWTNEGVLRANYVVEHGRRFGLMGTTGCDGAHEAPATVAAP